MAVLDMVLQVVELLFYAAVIIYIVRGWKE